MRVPIEIQAMSRSDDACFLGQKAVADAAEADANYRIVGGNMVRMLGEVYPAPRAFSRSTVDVDAAVDEVEVIGSIADRLKADSFHQESGNLFVKSVTPQRRIEVNLLMPYRGPSQGKSVRAVPGLGQVDTFPELTFAMAQAPLELDMTVTLTNKEEVLTYTTFIPSLESAVILKAHAWKGRLKTRISSTCAPCWKSGTPTPIRHGVWMSDRCAPRGELPPTSSTICSGRPWSGRDVSGDVNGHEDLIASARRA